MGIAACGLLFATHVPAIMIVNGCTGKMRRLVNYCRRSRSSIALIFRGIEINKSDLHPIASYSQCLYPNSTATPLPLSPTLLPGAYSVSAKSFTAPESCNVRIFASSIRRKFSLMAVVSALGPKAARRSVCVSGLLIFFP